MTFYSTYIQSSGWRTSPARLGELEAAGYRCRLCNTPGGEVPLEAHHRTYDRLGNERIGDLTALCRDCHRVVTDLLRRRRYALRSPRFSNVARAILCPSPLTDPTRMRTTFSPGASS
jgi:5-methylcytosine-specific restriction endonuclease McrA